MSFKPLLLAGILLLTSACMKQKPESLPDRLVWNPEVAIPLGIDSFGLNAESGFDTTLFDLDELSGLPEWVSEQELVMEGRMEFNLAALDENLENMEQILFRVSIYNGFPNKMRAQAYFVDASSNPIDSVFKDGPVPVAAGIPIGNGETINPTVEREDAIFSKERFDPLYEATAIILRSVFYDIEVDTTLVEFYRDYRIQMEIGAMLELSFEF